MAFNLQNAKQLIASQASELLGIEIDAQLIEVANPKAGSHLALPCFKFAAQLQQSPQQIAQKLALELSNDEIAEVQAAGPYVNIWLHGIYLAEQLNDSENLLRDADSNGKTAVIEFLSPNLAKPLSIGHLRNALQGKVIARAYQNAGYHVITDNHIGDWGTVFGMWVVGFQQFSSEEQLAEDGVKELGRMYVEVRKALKEEESQGGTELKDLIQSWLKRLEDGDEEAWNYHRRFSEISLGAIEQQMAELEIHFDYNLGESVYIARGKEMVGELLEQGIAHKNDDGSVIVPLDDMGIETPMLIEKANGAALYATSDIATIEYREKNWDPDSVIYVVGAEQQFHFKQLFAANAKAHWSDAELIHHWYGLIEEIDENGNRSKMSSRTNAVFMADLLNLALEKARAIAPEDISDDDVKKIAHGALTFREFSGSHKGNTLFDWESMFSLSGYSGPYVQYAAVRISSILEKAGDAETHYVNSYDWSMHSDILWLVSQFESVVADATAEREFHKIAEFAYALAKEWNRFYENTPILGSEGEERTARLWLAKIIHGYLVRALYLIGINAPTRM